MRVAVLAGGRSSEHEISLASARSVLWRLYVTAYDQGTVETAQTYCRKGAARFPDDMNFVLCRLWLQTMPGIAADPDEARRMGLAGRARAVEQFGWDAVAAKTVELYESLR